MKPLFKIMRAAVQPLFSRSRKPASALGANPLPPTTANQASSSSPGDSDPHMLANIFLDQHGKEKGHLTLRFYQGQYWRWKDLRYQTISKDQLRAEVTGAVKRDFDQQAGKGPKDKRPMHVSSSLVTNVLQAVSSLTLVSGDLEQPILLNPNGHQYANLVSMANGLLDLDGLFEGKTPAVRRPTPDWFSSVTLPYAFDPGSPCPRWMEFLNKVLEQDEQRINLLQEWFGVLLHLKHQGTQVSRHGRRGHGSESVVCEILAAMLGEDNVSHVPLEVFGERFQLTATVGKLANIAPEVGELKSVAEGISKAVHLWVSGCILTARECRPCMCGQLRGSCSRRTIALTFPTVLRDSCGVCS